MKIESIINFEYITPCKNDSCEKLCEINIPDNIQKAKKKPTNKRANVARACYFFNLACQRAKGVPKTCQIFNLACQPAKRHDIFSTSSAERRANFSTIFQKNFVFLFT